MGSAYADWGYVPTSGGNATYLEEDFSIGSTYYLEPVDLNNPSPLFDAPMHPIQVLPLPSGNLLVSGQFWRDFGTNHPAVIQHTDAQAHVIDQYVNDSPFEDDIPAVIRAMDLAGDGSLYFAQMNNWNGNAYIYSPFPSQVEITHLDTSLNVLGRYVFDGTLDSIFYVPYNVLSTPDGGVLVLGMKRELSIPGAPAKAWIAKLGPDNFTAIREDHDLVLKLYPNPGTEGFNLNLKERVEQGRIQLHDMQGRLLLDRALDGINVYVPTPNLATGLYAVTIRDRSGKVLQSLRWAKN
ncbi:MAG: T9SS type A sorting domain-containing protein [Flavobacteriales bacterium]|nr:T9SS type A sorting domain-containing protein [Flavobacteriales bacterium]